MNEFELWIYRLIIGGLAIIVWYAIQRLIKKFDELINSINALTETSKVQQTQISGINNQLQDHTGRMNDHSKRLRSIELGCATNHNNEKKGK